VFSNSGFILRYFCHFSLFTTSSTAITSGKSLLQVHRVSASQEGMFGQIYSGKREQYKENLGKPSLETSYTREI
jgi:hypothetical protein